MVKVINDEMSYSLQEIVGYLNEILMDEDPELAQFVYSSNGFEELVSYNGINIVNEDSDFDNSTEYTIIMKELMEAIDSMLHIKKLLQAVGPPGVR